MEFCRHLIVVPLSTFHRLSELIGDPQGQLIFLFNTTRCGSTLLAQVHDNCRSRRGQVEKYSHVFIRLLLYLEYVGSNNQVFLLLKYVFTRSLAIAEKLRHACASVAQNIETNKTETATEGTWEDPKHSASAACTKKAQQINVLCILRLKRS